MNYYQSYKAGVLIEMIVFMMGIRNDADIDKVLRALIYGVDCVDGEIAEQRALQKRCNQCK